MTLYPPIPEVRVIGIVGAARHGKDVFAKALMRQVPGAERWAFSDLIACHERLKGRMTARNPLHLQDAGAALDRKLLLMAMYEAIADHRPPLAIVTGMRKQDEIALIKGLGGTIVRVVRVLPGGKRYQATDRDLSHPIEQEIESIEADITFEASTIRGLEGYAVAFQADMLT